VNDGRRILVCDDEPQILRALRVILRDAGFEVVTAASAEEALDAASVHPPDAAILDLVLPDGDGVGVTREIREWSEMPILVLSAVGEEAEKIRALDAGADDYITKPFGPGELVARLNAVLRRTDGEPDEPTIVVDELELDLAARSVALAGKPVHLTPTEYELLRALVHSRGRLMTHSTILREVWGPAYEDDTPLLRAHVANLRRKIEPEPSRPRYVTTDPGIGYRFAA
jgi:two-component system, OmpR family, KDP operon response regulator KdpE